ncbi:uncharacterized protein L201_005879 [Kwoniella dendrophila CBS 6074]|uniref:WSC domain-containing protein n=1 Tax=Kwoniella dendrophila CBS 6074 TaxID=1295534 RepID=A0AAX4JZN0_9TREE
MVSIYGLLPVLAYLAVAGAGPINDRRATTSTTGPTSTTTQRASNDLQVYNLGLGSIYAPAVTKSGNFWYSSGQQYNFLTESLHGSCYFQMNDCQNKANQQGNKPFAVSDCNGWQIQDCLSKGDSAGATSSSSSVAATSSSKAAASSSSSVTASSSSSKSSSTAASSSSSSTTASSSSSSSAASSSSSKVSSTSSSTASPTTAPTTVAAGNYQTFTQAAGGVVAPTVTRVSDYKWVQSGTTYSDLYSALQQSCYAQASSCSSSSASFDKNVCWNSQVSACLSNAQSASGTYTSSVASANFAAATQARTVSGDLQTFKGALGGIPAPAVTGTQYNWKVDGRSDNFYNLIDALTTSCYIQQGKAGDVGASTNWAYEMTTDNIYNVQINNCLKNAQQVASNWSPSSSSAPSPVNTAASSTSTATSTAATSASNAKSSTASSSVTSTSTSIASSSTITVAPTTSTVDLALSSALAYSKSVSEAAYSASLASVASVASSAAVEAAKIPSGWSIASTHCVAEGSRGRALIGAALATSDMTYKKCADFCESKGFDIFGIEYSQECYCGSTLSNGASLTRPSTNCNMKCGGSEAICGGPSALTLFVKDSAISAGSLSSDLTTVKVTLPDGWAAAPSTCVREGTSGRALAGASLYDENMTVGKCLTFCKSQGMQWAGIEYSRECYCGNDLVNGASLDRTGSCDMPCPGQLGTTCGGPDLLSLYKDSSLLYSLTTIGAWSKQGCIQEVGGRALNGASLATNDMTLEKCTSFCADKGFAFAGLEYSSECYCGNSLVNGATLGAFSTQCNMPCSGNAKQICGGPNGISLYSTLSGNALIGA